MIERTIATGTHGRYLVASPASAGAAPVLVGFHGYGENAEVQLERMQRTPGADRWRLVSIQGLHRFYNRRTNEVVASWMTRQDRELAIADTLAYVAAVMDAVGRDFPGAPRTVFAGFSQGVATALRAAAARTVDGVIVVGGDVPPELDADSLGRVRHALACRGTRDQWYAQATFEQDLGRLRAANVEVQPLEFDGEHEWSDAVVQAVRAFLREQLR